MQAAFSAHTSGAVPNENEPNIASTPTPAQSQKRVKQPGAEAHGLA